MYKAAYKYNDEVVFYFDSAGNKYVATGGSLAWRINNPGLVHSHTHFSRKLGSIGSFGPYAIFSHPQNGRKALAAWIHSKKYFNSSLKTLAKHYQPGSPDVFINQLSFLSDISPERKIKTLSQKELERLLISIEKLCGYNSTDNETFSLLPKIIAKIENGKDQEDTYLIGDSVVLSKKESIEWIQSHRLDGVIVQEGNGVTYLRSRPNHWIWNIKTHKPVLFPSEEKIDTLMRVIGENKTEQCIWAFINGINNTKEEALASAELISKAAGGEKVLSMPNDTLWAPVDFLTCLVLKASLDTPIIAWAVKFLRYLIAISKQAKDSPPVIVFLHSQGAIFIEHAMEFLRQEERKQLRIFTFGGGSFIAPDKSHPDSHNYASAADFVCRFGSPNLQLLALERYYGNKKGLTDNQIIAQLSMGDAMLHLDSIDSKVIEAYIKQRTKYYENEFSKIRNLTILDPDPGSKWKHTFISECYQQTIQEIIKKYQRNR